LNSELHNELALAPQWGLAVGQAGKICVWAAIAFFAISLLGYALGGRKAVLTKVGTVGLALGSLSLFGAFGCLITLFVENQFQFQYVFARADIHTDLKYKIAGVWSGQEGSFLLWGVCSAIFGLLALRGTGPYLRGFGATFALFLGSIAGILAYETPFNVMKEVIDGGHVHMPPTGNGMTPSLQNYWIAIHPPTIFLGFGSLTILFAYAVAAILHRDVNGWAMRARPWSLVGTAVLALGICMGGFWAYETLGWGGFWMWDPVENASFVPWLFLAALVHGIIVQISRSRWHGANLWLAALPFLTFVYGTFLTRSGAMGDTSVHSFANMDRAALNILKGLMGVFFVGFAALYFWRGRGLAKAADKPMEVREKLHREGMYVGGSLLLALFGAMLAIGMSWPLFMTMAGRSAARIEEPVYHKVVGWFFVPIMLLMAIAPFVSWRGMGTRALSVRLVNVLSIAAGTVGFLLIALRGPSWGLGNLGDASVAMPFGFRMSMVPWIAFLLTICAFAAVANLWRLAETMRRSRSSAGAFLSHFGLAVLLAGLIGSRGFEREQRTFVRQGDAVTALDYRLQYREMTGKSIYDRDAKIVFDVTGPDGEKFESRPGLFYNRNVNSGKDEPFTWPDIRRGLGHDVYLAMGAPLTEAWEGEGHWFRPGEEHTIQGITVKYDKFTMDGAPGQAGTKFGARLAISVTEKEGDPPVTYLAHPTFAVGPNGGPDMPLVGRDLRVAIVGMDAKDRAVRLQMLFAAPIFPIHIYTKPLTALVWGGTGILFFGGLLSAWARRRTRAAHVEEEEPEPMPSPSATPTAKDAPVPAT
jgi:cytochrome c-type biogenesis protein CcmF